VNRDAQCDAERDCCQRQQRTAGVFAQWAQDEGTEQQPAVVENRES
jgi:hypothetical protein